MSKRKLRLNYLDGWAIFFVGFIFGNEYRRVSLGWGMITFIVIFLLLGISSYWKLIGDYMESDQENNKEEN